MLNRSLSVAPTLLALAVAAVLAPLPGEEVRAALLTPPPAKVAGPKAQFAQPVVDFGRVMPTELKRHEFVVTNAGSAVLEITNVSPGCGCTTAGEWDREIAPGQSGKIPIAFNPASFSGSVSKTITVTTNDREHPMQVLELKANVWRPFVVQPTFANFLPVEGEPSMETKVIRILNNGTQPASLQPPVSSDERFKAELKTIRAGMEFELHVSFDSQGSAGSPNASITIQTLHKDQPVLTVTAFAMSQPPVVVVPATLQLPPASMGQNFNHNIVVRNNSRTPLQVTEAVTTIDGATVKIVEAQPGKLFYLNLALPPGFQAAANGPAEVIAKTSNRAFPEIRVPIVFPHPDAPVPPRAQASARP